MYFCMIVTCSYMSDFNSGVYLIGGEGEGRDGYRDQIVMCDVRVSLHAFQDTSTVRIIW